MTTDRGATRDKNNGFIALCENNNDFINIVILVTWNLNFQNVKSMLLKTIIILALDAPYICTRICDNVTR